MNENRAMNDHEDDFEDDELMRKVSKPPEFPAADPEQVESTWRAIEARIAEAEQATAAGGRAASGSPRWWQSLFPAAPAWSWQVAQVAALLVVGFGAAWIAASRGWLPGTAVDEVPTVAAIPDAGGSGDAGEEAGGAGDAGPNPNRAWLAATDYSSRLEALLLGVAKGERSEDVAPVARQVSRELLRDNRFYERVARSNDDPAVADLLSRIEVVLLALATAPEGEEQEVISMLREFIDDSDVLGDLRAVRSTVPQMRRGQSTTAGS